jgi:hypothetical protein
MDSGAIIIILLIAAGIGGFIVLAKNFLTNWRVGSKGKEEADSLQSQRSREFEQCYNACMGTEHWDPDSAGACVSRCRNFPAV